MLSLEVVNRAHTKLTNYLKHLGIFDMVKGCAVGGLSVSFAFADSPLPLPDNLILYIHLNFDLTPFLEKYVYDETNNLLFLDNLKIKIVSLPIDTLPFYLRNVQTDLLKIAFYEDIFVFTPEFIFAYNQRIFRCSLDISNSNYIRLSELTAQYFNCLITVKSVPYVTLPYTKIWGTIPLKFNECIVNSNQLTEVSLTPLQKGYTFIFNLNYALITDHILYIRDKDNYSVNMIITPAQATKIISQSGNIYLVINLKKDYLKTEVTLPGEIRMESHTVSKSIFIDPINVNFENTPLTMNMDIYYSGKRVFLISGNEHYYALYKQNYPKLPTIKRSNLSISDTCTMVSPNIGNNLVKCLLYKTGYYMAINMT